mgnify:CR=1 FL=1
MVERGFSQGEGGGYSVKTLVRGWGKATAITPAHGPQDGEALCYERFPVCLGCLKTALFYNFIASCNEDDFLQGSRLLAKAIPEEVFRDRSKSSAFSR